MKTKLFLFLFCWLLLCVGCGLPKAVRMQAEEAPEQVRKASREVADSDAEYQKILNNSPMPHLDRIAEREKTAAGFDVARKAVEDAKSQLPKVAEFLQRNKSSEQQAVMATLTFIAKNCHEAKTASQKPVQQLQDWITIYNSAVSEKAEAEKEVGEVDLLIQENLAEGKELLNTLQKRQTDYPHKRDDLQKRLDGVLETHKEIQTNLETVRLQTGYILSGHEEMDIAVFSAALTKIDELGSGIELLVEDLDNRCDQLEETSELMITRLEKYPSFWAEYGKSVWSDSDWDDNTDSIIGWKQLPDEAAYTGLKEDQVVESSGSEWYSGSQTWVSDKEIRYQYFATSVEKINGDAGQPVHAEVDEEVWHEYLESARKLHELYPQARVIQHEEKSATLEDGEPIRHILDVRFVTEQKVKGQYDEDVPESPSVEGVPLALIGDANYGKWEGEGVDKHWVFHDHYYGGGGSNNLLLGYMMGRWSAPGYGSYYSYGNYDRYSGWRRDYGFDSDWYDNEGRYHGNTGGRTRSTYNKNTTLAGGSLRGVGQDARSRGLGSGK